jgi:hypothetical protein
MTVSRSALYRVLERHCREQLDAGSSPEELATAVNAGATSPNKTRVTIATLLSALTPEQCDLVLRTLSTLGAQSAYVAGVRDALSGPGIDMSDPRAEQFVRTVLQPHVGDAVSDLLVDLGTIHTPWLPSPVSSEEVVAALQWHHDVLRLQHAITAAQIRIDEGGDLSDAVAAFAASAAEEAV